MEVFVAVTSEQSSSSFRVEQRISMTHPFVCDSIFFKYENHLKSNLISSLN